MFINFYLWYFNYRNKFKSQGQAGSKQGFKKKKKKMGKHAPLKIPPSPPTHSKIPPQSLRCPRTTLPALGSTCAQWLDLYMFWK